MKKKPKSLSALVTSVRDPHPIRRDELEELLEKQIQYSLELEFIFWGTIDHSALCPFNEEQGEECTCAPGGTSWLEYLIKALHDSNPCPRCRVPMEGSFCNDCGYSNY